MATVTSETPMISSILYSAGTDVGMRREENQDSYGILIGDAYRLFIVADGMGGVQGGSIASNLALAEVEKYLRDKSDITIKDVVAAVKNANEQIHKQGNADSALNGMGTTLVGLLLSRRGAFSIHVGDSRAYHVSDKKIARLTEDHTLVQELVRSGAITEEQAEHHPVAHMLTRSLGPSANIEIEYHQIAHGVKNNDRFLLCSDGLYNLVSEAEIAEVLSSQSTDDAAQILIDLANERGGSDNITVIIVDAQQYSVPPIEDDYIEEPEITVSQKTKTSNLTNGYHQPSDVSNQQTNEITDNNEVHNAAPEIKDQPPIQENTRLEEPIVEESSESLPDENVASSTTAQTEQPSFTEEDQLISDTLVVPRTNFPALTKLPIIIVSFLGGLLVSYLLFASSPDEVDQEETIILSKSSGIDPEFPDKAPLTIAFEEEEKFVPIKEVAKIGPAERTSILKRKSDLELVVKDTTFKIELLKSTSRSDLEEQDRTLKKRAEDLKSRIDQLRTDIDVATRRLATWYERKRRLETVDVVNMASELSVSMPIIKTKKDEFEKATWDYLKEVEAMRYSASDPQREAKIQSLVQIRSAKMKELGQEVRQIIQKSLDEADDSVAILTLQRSGFEKELELVRNEIDFLRTASNAEAGQKSELIEVLEAKKQTALIELDELIRLLAA